MTPLRTLLVFATLQAPVWGQCVMCREAAVSQQKSAITALNSGILILGLPVAAAFLGFAHLLRRYGSK